MQVRNGYIPQLLHHRAKNRAYVKLNGKPRYLGPWGAPEAKAAYDALIRRWLDHGRRLPEDDEAPPTIAELVNAFRKHADTHYRKNGRRTSEFHCFIAACRPVLELYSSTPIDGFGPLALEACRNALVAGGGARTVINQHVSRIRSVFRWGVSREMVAPDQVAALESLGPLLAGRTTAPERPKVPPAPEADVAAVRAKVPEPVRGLIDLQLASGCRPGEAVVCRAADIDMVGMLVDGVRVWLWRPKNHKGEHLDKERVIYLGPRAQEVLRPRLAGDPAAWLFVSDHPRWKGRPFTVSGYRQAIARECEGLWPTGRYSKWPPADGAKIAEEAAAANSRHHWHPHQLRHNAGTRIRREHGRDGLELARVLLGHESIDTTAIYAEADREKAAAAAARSG